MALPEKKRDRIGDRAFRWGTWEELLLAFAVKRHGTGAWSSIAAELQKRSAGNDLSLTAQNCKQRYDDIKRRFVSQNKEKSVSDDESNGEGVARSVPLLEELRKLRVAELRVEVQRYDLNIELLKSKMKNIEDNWDMSTRGEKIKSDLEIKKENIKGGSQVEKVLRMLPEKVTSGQLLNVAETEKDRLSVNESNSTDLGAEKLRSSERGSEPVATERAEVEQKWTGQSGDEPEDLKAELAREISFNGSSNSIEKDSTKTTAMELDMCSRDLLESEAESKGGGDDAMKETSDVQSSASRSRKEGGDKVHCGSTSGYERDLGVQYRAGLESSAQSQPSIDFLRAIWAHKLGSIFKRRLRSQESSDYQKLILQHIDLDAIEARSKEGWYSGSASKFYRDLLLLVNNAIVFFSKDSSEFLAAIEIRQLISSEMSQKLAKSESPLRKHISLQSLSGANKVDLDPSPSLLLKPGISGSLIVCGKRSSIAAKASFSSSGSDDKKKEKEQNLIVAEEDLKVQPPELSGNAEEQKVTKKRTRDRFSSVSANSKNGKNQGNNNGSKNQVVEAGRNQGKGGSSQQSELKAEKKKSQPSVDSKKRGAASFLNRMKQSSSSNNGDLLDVLKNTPLTRENTNNKGGPEQKKNNHAKHGEKRSQVTRRSLEMRQAKEKESPSPVKRNVGRPPKKGAPISPALGKPGRETSEPEVAAPK